jgi:hypothetical protein
MLRRQYNAGMGPTMIRARSQRLWMAVTRRRIVTGRCAVCHGTVFEDERSLRPHGVLMHRRCATYRRSR